MAQKILVYGHGDTTRHGFPTPGHIEIYLAGEIFTKWKGRYQFSQQKEADIIVLSRKGYAYGHFEIARTEAPNSFDRKAYPRAKKTYLVKRSYRYQNPVKLFDLGIAGYQFGKHISESEFAEIQAEAGSIHKYTR